MSKLTAIKSTLVGTAKAAGTYAFRAFCVGGMAISMFEMGRAIFASCATASDDVADSFINSFKNETDEEQSHEGTEET